MLIGACDPMLYPMHGGGGQAEGQRLDIVAAENVRLLAGECVVTDLCAAAAFADRLQRALQ